MARKDIKHGREWERAVTTDELLGVLPITAARSPSFGWGTRRLMLITSAWLRHAVQGTMNKEFSPEVQKEWECAADAGTGIPFVEALEERGGFLQEIPQGFPPDIAQILQNGRQQLLQVFERAAWGDVLGVLHRIEWHVLWTQEILGDSQKCELFDQKQACNIVRDVVCNPFRPVTISPTWITPDVSILAQAIYEERRFQDMPLLGDALECAEANEWILNHCRSAKIHVPGCYVVDMIRRMSGTEIRE